MKACKALPHVFAVGGMGLMVIAVIGRFVYERSVFGSIIPGGMAASSVMIGANTLLLLAILSRLCNCDQKGEDKQQQNP